MTHHYSQHEPTGPLLGVSCANCTTDASAAVRNSGEFHATEADVRKFAERWPAFGAIRALRAEFDSDGGLAGLTAPDVSEWDDMDERGVRAIVDDLQAGVIGHRAADHCCPDFDKKTTAADPGAAIAEFGLASISVALDCSPGDDDDYLYKFGVLLVDQRHEQGEGAIRLKTEQGKRYRVAVTVTEYQSDEEDEEDARNDAERDEIANRIHGA